MIDSQERAYAETLGQVIADLDYLNHNTEQDFLRIGGKLAEFIEAVNLISSELTALADPISGDQARRTSQDLTFALDRFTEMRGRAEEDNSLLGNMRQEAGRLKQTLGGFEGAVATFHTLGVLTRIETARLGSTGHDFGNLADEMRLAAGSIQTRVKTAVDNGAHLIQPLESVLRHVSALQEAQAQDLPGLIAGAVAGLSSFRDIQNKTHNESARLSAQYDAISGAFKNLIVSIQFHDITRQQVEHVIEALRRLSSESEGENGNIPRDDSGSAAILALQSSQLADAGEKFAALIASVEHNLDQIAGHVLEIAGESRTLSGSSEDETNSFFLQMERGCTAILASLNQCAKAQAAIRATSGDLTETIGRMRGPIEEIRTIEIQMRRMAMNARISAFHLGPTGDALGVLAGSVQQLSSECRERSESLVDALGSMSEAATRLSGQDRQVAASARSSQDICLERMRTAVTELHTASERNFAEIAQIVAHCDCLRDNISATRDGASVGALFAESVSRARKMLKEIGAETHSDLSPDGIERWECGLAEFATHYTMQAERDVHEGIARVVAGAAHVTVRTEEAEVSPKEAEELGENVEFF